MKTVPVLLLMLSFLGSAFAQEPPASYERYCINCHGADGKANTTAGKKMKLPSFASDEVQKQTDGQLFDSIANGTTHKQYPHAFARKGVSGLEIREIIKFIRSLRAGK
jgi:mono/diheme cytochrome c family protein